MEEKELLTEMIADAIENKRFKELCEKLEDVNPVDIAEAMDGLDEKQVTVVFRLLKKETAADAFAYMEPDVQEALIKSLSDTELTVIVEDMEMDDAADLIEEMPANVVARILKNSSPERRKTINELLLYPEDSAGSIMNVEYISLRKEMTVEEAILKIQKIFQGCLNIFIIVVKCVFYISRCKCNCNIFFHGYVCPNCIIAKYFLLYTAFYRNFFYFTDAA